MNFAVCNAGDSLVEISLYSVTSVRPIVKVREKRASMCEHISHTYTIYIVLSTIALGVQAGSNFVDIEAERFLCNALTSAGISSEDVAEYTNTGIKDFKSFAKSSFDDENRDQSIVIAGNHFKNTTLRVNRGQMILAG
jgi:hypothetical protein